jgi:benzoyl-CoA 2,3-dioxygenase component B
MSNIDLSSRIPNNVDLTSDRRLQRALEQWQPAFLDWWGSMGPLGFQADDVYLRTAISTEPGGWAHFDYVKMPDYRWGIFLDDAIPDRRIGFGDHFGEPVWQTVPGEHRNTLQRIIVTQADTEPASVEQQRYLGQTAPSLYDLRNLFQVNVEEGRHLWAMVYLLHAHFGRDGRDEADALLERRSGDENNPRLLDAFNQECPDWLTFFCFTTFTDRDGKYQLASLAESGFDPLSRTCKFMLTEEAHHLAVGEDGVRRVLERAVALEKQEPNGDVRKLGGVDTATIQKYINYWFSYSIDLFGSEVSSNAATYFAAGIKGRYREDTAYTDHVALDGTIDMRMLKQGVETVEQVALRNAMNELLRRAYIEDAERVVERWNRAMEDLGTSFRVKLPDARFFRRQGIYSGLSYDPSGNLLTAEAWEARKDEWLPSAADRQYVRSLMHGVHEPGKVANWIAPPRRGINKQAVDFEYVRHV